MRLIKSAGQREILRLNGFGHSVALSAISATSAKAIRLADTKVTVVTGRREGGKRARSGIAKSGAEADEAQTEQTDTVCNIRGCEHLQLAPLKSRVFESLEAC
jgi:hypothetical protein